MIAPARKERARNKPSLSPARIDCPSRAPGSARSGARSYECWPL